MKRGQNITIGIAPNSLETSEEVPSKQMNQNPATHTHLFPRDRHTISNFLPALSTTDVEIMVSAICSMANTMVEEVDFRAEPVDWKTAAL